MIAYIGLIGSSAFRHTHGTRTHCEEWLNAVHDKLVRRGASPANMPRRIIDDSSARSLRWQDGRPVFPCVQKGFDQMRDGPCGCME